MKRILFILPLLLTGCLSQDEIKSVSVDVPIEYSISGVEGTKATLVTNNNVASQFETMDVVALTSTGTEKFRQTLDTKTCTTNDVRYWTQSQALTFFSYPKGKIEPTFDFSNNVCCKFHYKAGTDSKSTPDIVLACTGASTGEKVNFKYEHVFTAVCVKYEEMKSAHTIKKVVVEGACTEGDCEMSYDTKKPFWKNQGEGAVLSDTESKRVYYNGQLITEDGYIFMIVPDDSKTVKVKVWIDSVAEPVNFEYKLNSNYGGQLITFNIKDKEKTTPGGGTEPDVKTVTKNDDGTYSITIDAFVTGSVTTTTKTMPTNTVFVLDASGSMSENLTDDPLAYHKCNNPLALDKYKTFVNTGFDTLDKVKGAEAGYYAANVSAFGNLRDVRYNSGHWQFHNETKDKWENIEDTEWTVKIYRRKISMMKSVCKDYVETIAATNAEHYVSVVSFSSSSSILCSKVDVRSGKQKIIDAINGISANGGTYTDQGIHNARTLLMDPAKYYNAMVVITDGEPGLTTFNASVANDAISKAHDCKNVYSAYVYSIGVFGKETPSDKCVAFLDRLSSNYKDATKYTNGTKTANSYYSLASSEEAIANVMKSIQKEVQEGGAAIQLGADSYVIDVVSDVFSIPQYGDVVLKQARYNETTKTFGAEEDITDMTVTYTLDGTTKEGYTLKVVGFDYSKYFCGTGNKNGGRKLVIHINGLKLNPDAPAGSYTNESGSGLYDSEGNLVDEFNYPRI